MITRLLDKRTGDVDLVSNKTEQHILWSGEGGRICIFERDDEIEF